MANLLLAQRHAESVGGNSAVISVTPTLTVHANYATGDYVGTSGVPMTFSNAALAPGGTGMIVGALLVDYALQSVAGELWLFDTLVTPPADSAAWTITDAHSATCLGVIPFPAASYYASAANSVCIVNGLSIIYQTLTLPHIYGCFVTRGTPTYASGDLTFRLRMAQD